MADVVSPETRSRMMSGIRGKNTKPELQLRKRLFAKGLRYRLHAELPGRPDLVFSRYRAAVFVHGCFWHRHSACRFATTPATRPEFWQQKFHRNVERDAGNTADLLQKGWRVGIVWECAIRSDPEGAAERTADWLSGNAPYFEYPVLG